MSGESDEMTHISADLLERYSLHQLSEEQLAPVEEHLLLCPVCQQVLTEIDEFVAAMKIAARQITETKAPTQRPLQRALPLTSGVLVTALLVFIYLARPSALPESAITLIAKRGASAGASTQAPAHTALAITAVAPEISPGREVRLELVDSQGRVLWQGSGESQLGQVSARINRSLDAGSYWLRAYEDSRLLQEYGLQVQVSGP